MQTFTGLQYLMMDIAAAYGHGLDKQTWDQRLDWYENHKTTLRTQLKDADEPARMLAGILAMEACDRGEPTGFMCQLDATASGLQLLSVMAGCAQSAATCNLVDVGTQVDAYTLTYNEMRRRLQAAGHTTHHIARKPLKNAVMTHLYGSTRVPKNIFGEGTPELAMFYQTLDDLMPGANILNKDLLSLWQSDNLEHAWTLPDGFEVRIPVIDDIVHEVTFLGQPLHLTQKINRPMEQGRSLGANIVHSIDGMVVREMNRRCNFDRAHVGEVFQLLLDPNRPGTSTSRQQDIDLLWLLSLQESTGFTSMAIIDLIDDNNSGLLTQEQASLLEDLIRSLPDQSFPLLAIHDCFRFHPNHGNDVRRQYRNILADLADNDITSFIASQITGRGIIVHKPDPQLSQLVRQSEYALA